MLYVTEEGDSAEIAVTGNDGLVGAALFMGGESTPNRAVVQSAGEGYRLRSSILKREFALGGPLQLLALRFTQALITQMSQTAVCNRHHTLQQQLCRWLVLSLDRLPGNDLTMTQELITNMLGVRREGVTHAAGKLQEEGIIRYSRGHITVIDRAKLKQHVCECHANSPIAMTDEQVSGGSRPQGRSPSLSPTDERIRAPKSKKPSGRMAHCFVSWLPDLGSNQGPAD